jgi:glycosyltransferase involved in cell wall biosynthesis
MRILQINDYPIEGGGGAEVVLARTIELLRGRGADVALFTAADLPDRRPGVRRYVDNPIARQALAARLRTYRPDVVHLHNFYHVLSPGILAELERYRAERPVRVVMTVHDYHLVCPNSGGTWYPGRLAVPAPIDAARIAAASYLLTRRWDCRGVSRSLLKLAQHFWSYRWLGRRRVVDVAICPSRYLEALVRPAVRATRLVPHPAPEPKTRVPRPTGLRLIFVGRLEPEKGLNEFLEALPSAFNGTLAIVGDGSESARCRHTCWHRDIGARVRFLGRLPHAQTLSEIARAHVLVQPSRCLESYGLTLIEALTAGTNVLAAGRGALRELVEDAGVGYLFPPGDANSLAIQLDRIRRAHQAGTLNRFDVAPFLAARSESAYVEALWDVYGGAARELARAA